MAAGFPPILGSFLLITLKSAQYPHPHHRYPHSRYITPLAEKEEEMEEIEEIEKDNKEEEEGKNMEMIRKKKRQELFLTSQEL